jgi:hypothetical protein
LSRQAASGGELAVIDDQEGDMNKIDRRSMMLVADAQGRGDTVDGILYTDRRPNTFEREQLAACGCTFLGSPAATVNRVRFEAPNVNLIVNLGFVERIDLFER